MLRVTKSILFVCLGNICRSPLAEGVFRAEAEVVGLVDQFFVDSAGTGAWHEGNPPDPRSIEVAASNGIDISSQRARQIARSDFNSFDYILAMDASNLTTLRERANGKCSGLRLFLDQPPTDVPDPYYGGDAGFEDVYQMLKAGSQTFLRQFVSA